MPDRLGPLHRVRNVALAAILAIPLMSPAISFTEDAPPEASTEIIPAEDNTASIMKTVDEKHAGIERSILDRVVRFDKFFGNVKTETARQPNYLIRWQNSVRMEEGSHFKYRTNVRANFVLPGISERLRVAISGESEPEPFSAKLPEDPGNPGFDRTLANTRLVNTEIRYGFVRSPTVDLFLGAGVRLTRPFQYFTRSRLQYTHRLGDVSLVRFGETLFWKNTEKFGETTEIDFERLLGPKTLLRWSNAGTLAQETEGLEWGTELSLLQELSPRSAITFSGGAFGDTRPDAVVETYRILTRYRRNFLTKWLFYELEPEISWPRNPEGGYKSALAFTARLEVVFQGTPDKKEKKTVTPPK
jgi:hypothetical protein